MQFEDGTKVYSFDGQNVGHIDRVVLNPKTNEVTHLVVRKGFLFTEDKIIPLHMIASATENRVSLHENVGNLDELLPFEEIHYIPVDQADLHNADLPAGTPSALYGYPPMKGWMGYFGRSMYDYPASSQAEMEQNIPKGAIALKEGAQVFSADNQHVGNVTRVFTGDPHNRVSHFLISEGIFFKEKKLIPISWIREMQENEIHLSVGASVLHKLREYQEASKAI